MVRKIFFRHQKSLRHLAMTLTKYSISAHLGAPRRGLRGDVMVTCHGTKTRHGNTAKSHTNVMVFPYRRERSLSLLLFQCVAVIRHCASMPNQNRVLMNGSSSYQQSIQTSGTDIPPRHNFAYKPLQLLI